MGNLDNEVLDDEVLDNEVLEYIISFTNGLRDFPNWDNLTDAVRSEVEGI